MNLVVLGATGATGALVLVKALAAGHRVTALVRSPVKVKITNPNLRVLTGDATDASAVTAAMEAADAVISVLGGKKAVISDATHAILAGAQQQRVRRVVMLSSFAVQRDRLTPFGKFLTGMAMSKQIKDKMAGEEALRASGLDWTIVYASLLTNGPATGAVTVVPETSKRTTPSKISRADVATWLLKAATGDGGYIHESVGITADRAAA
jgi:uncharacterized protein YbjT (DUF2867 family)